MSQSTLPTTSGYPVTMFHPNLDPKYICVLCEQVLREPVQNNCGHRFCHVCLVRAIEMPGEVICDACRAENVSISDDSIIDRTSSFPDKALKREMNNLEVKCIFYGCPWTGTLKQFNAHSSECPFQTYQCGNCGQTLLLANSQTHTHSECSARELLCSYCGMNMPASQQEFHFTTCHKYPVKCLQCNNSNIARDEMLTHLRTNCVSDNGRCIFGCSEQIKPEEMGVHMSQNVDRHVQVIGSRLYEITAILTHYNIPLDTNNITPTSSVAVLEAKVRDIERVILGQISGQGDGASGGPPEDRMTAFEEKANQFEGKITALRDQINKCLEMISQNQAVAAAAASNVEDRPKQIQLKREVDTYKARIMDLENRIQAQESLSYDGTLIWKIPEFSKRRCDAINMAGTSLYSPPFFTNRTGYRICGRLYPNGDGMGKDKFVSLFFVVMRGPFDPLLPWPFKQKVTFFLLDQTGREHIVDAFRPDPSSSSFQRPSDEMNIASGCPTFVKLDFLTEKANRYLKEDVMYIKIVVSPLEG